MGRFSREARAAAKIRGTRGAGPRRRDARQRGAVHGHGVPRRLGPRGVVAQARPAAVRRGGRVRLASVRGARGGPFVRDRAPRSQAGEPLLHAPARRLALHQGARSRDLEARRRAGRLSGRGLDDTHVRGDVGTPYYMSPEQLRASRDVDARTDIWAMGVILHELTTGQVPFTGESLARTSASRSPPTTAASPCAPARCACRPRSGPCTMPAEGQEQPLRKRRRVRAGARAVCPSALARERRADLRHAPRACWRGVGAHP